jgi:dolichol-phosphate mannosyltransferase
VADAQPPPRAPARRDLRTLVVVPTYDERATIREVVARVLAADVDVDLLVVDDASPDGTGEVADELAAAHPEVHVLHRARKEGLGPAYRAGLGWGLERGYDVLVEMDADLSHDPLQLPALVDATRRADLVIGSRYVPGGRIENWPAHRLALSAGGNAYVRLVTGVPVRDATSGYRAFRRETLEGIGLLDLRSDGYSFQLEAALLAWRNGFAVEEVPITFVERTAGASKISRTIVFEALWRVLQWGLRGPRRGGPTHPDSVRAGG